MAYTPGPLPTVESGSDAQKILFFLRDELQIIAQSLLDDIIAVELRASHRVPSKPRVGMIAYADGTDWNPGGTGEGVYVYTSGGWAKL